MKDKKNLCIYNEIYNNQNLPLKIGINKYFGIHFNAVYVILM